MVNEVLKVKLNVPEFIKGADGKDYVITEADYMAIADVAKDLIDLSDIGGGIKEVEVNSIDELLSMPTGLYINLKGINFLKYNGDEGWLGSNELIQICDNWDKTDKYIVLLSKGYAIIPQDYGFSYQPQFNTGNGLQFYDNGIIGYFGINEENIMEMSVIKKAYSINDLTEVQDGLYVCPAGETYGYSFPFGLYNKSTDESGLHVTNVTTGEGFIRRRTEDGYQVTYIPPSTGGELDYDTITAEVLSRIPNGEEVSY